MSGFPFHLGVTSIPACFVARRIRLRQGIFCHRNEFLGETNKSVKISLREFSLRTLLVSRIWAEKWRFAIRFFSWTGTRFPFHTSSAKKLMLNQTPVIPVAGKAFLDVGHSLKHQRSKIKAEKPFSLLRSMGNSSGDETTSSMTKSYRLRQRLLSICGAGLLDSSWTLTLLDLRCLLFQVSARASISFCFSAEVTFRLGTVPLRCEKVASVIRPSGC